MYNALHRDGADRFEPMSLRRRSSESCCSGEMSGTSPKLRKCHSSDSLSPSVRAGSFEWRAVSPDALSTASGIVQRTGAAVATRSRVTPVSTRSAALEMAKSFLMTESISQEFDSHSQSSAGESITPPRETSLRATSQSPLAPAQRLSPDDRRDVQRRRIVRMSNAERRSSDWMGVEKMPIGSGALDMDDLAEVLDESKPATRANASFAGAAALRAHSMCDAQSARELESVQVFNETVYLAQLDSKMEMPANLLYHERDVLSAAELKLLLARNQLISLWSLAKVCVQARNVQDYTRLGQGDSDVNIRIASLLQLLCTQRNRKCTLYGRVIGNELKLRGLSDYGINALSQPFGLSTPKGVREYRNSLVAASEERFRVWLGETVTLGKALVVLLDDLHFGFAPRNPFSVEEIYINRGVANCLAIRRDENAIDAQYDDKGCVTAHPAVGAEWTKVDRHTSYAMTSTLTNGFVDSMGLIYNGRNFNNEQNCVNALRAFDYAQPDVSEERRLFSDNVCLVEVFDLKLKSWKAWLQSAILLVDRFRPYLDKQWLILMPGDWPVQFYFRLLVRQYRETTIPQHVLNGSGMGVLDCQRLQHFVPLLGPFHCGLNLIEDVERQYHAVFVKFYAAVFGKRWQDKPRVHRVHSLVAILWGSWRKVRNEILGHIKGTELQRYPEVQCLWWLLDTLVPLACDLYAVFSSGVILTAGCNAFLCLALLQRNLNDTIMIRRRSFF